MRWRRRSLQFSLATLLKAQVAVAVVASVMTVLVPRFGWGGAFLFIVATAWFWFPAGGAAMALLGALTGADRSRANVVLPDELPANPLPQNHVARRRRGRPRRERRQRRELGTWLHVYGRDFLNR
jgi:hypothetical protein